MLEKKIATAIEPVLDELVQLEKRINSLVLQPGEKGEPGVSIKSLEAVDGALRVELSNSEVCSFALPAGERGEKGDKGEPGQPGAPGIDGAPGASGVSVKAIRAEGAKAVIELTDGQTQEIELPPGPPGDRGEKGDKGDPGDRGTDGLPGVGIRFMVGDGQKMLVELTTGDKIEFALPAGEKGEKGDPGEPGAEGVGIKEIRLSGNEAEIELDNGKVFGIEIPRGEKGETGEKGDRGEQGERGDRGADGLGLETKIWSPGIYREGTYVTADIGKFYRAKRDTTAKPGGSEDWERIGSSGFAWKGVKDPEAQYEDGDLYIDNGSCFLWWNGKGRMFVQKGPKGERGERGADGTNAAVIVAVKMDLDGVHFALDDGNVHSAEIEGFKDHIDRLVKAQVEARLAELDDLIEERIKARLKNAK